MKDNKTRSYLIEFLILFFLTHIFFNFIQSLEYVHNPFSIKRKIYLWFHVICTAILIFGIFRSYRKQGVLNKITTTFLKSNIPGGMKLALIIVFTGNFIAVAVAESAYPFYDVGMFRWPTDFNNAKKIVYKPKYFYKDNDEVKILELRKEGFFFLSEHFGWGFTHEFTFAANYHNRGQKKNFEFLLKEIKKQGIDSLWVGVHTVNYETGEVRFDTDLCKAIKVNATQRIHYGPVYIPIYQLKNCDEI